jgi:hypothetical protein
VVKPNVETHRVEIADGHPQPSGETAPEEA